MALMPVIQTAARRSRSFKEGIEFKSKAWRRRIIFPSAKENCHHTSSHRLPLLPLAGFNNLAAL
jgi:hypothetical protein